MNLTIQELETKMEKISQLIENERFRIAYIMFQEIDNDIETRRYTFSEINAKDRKSISDFYSSYAYFLFGLSEYTQFFEKYIKAQKYGYPFEKRREFIYEAFVKPNLEDFKSNYTKNIAMMKAVGCINASITFEELPYWLITTGVENEYYLYDKEMDLIREKFILDIDKSMEKDIVMNTNISDYMLISNGCWSEIQPYIKEISSKGKKSYIVTSDIGKLLSYFQGSIIDESYINKIIVLKDIDEFKSYFMNRNNYLPRSFIGPDVDRLKYANVIEEIHKYRLNKDNRFGNNVLLSVCIPSYNRGKRAYDNVIHTLQSCLDEEIEIVVSNNGTKNESKEFYEKIKELEDSRVTYFEFDENQGMALNFCKAIELAKGKYALLLSDEDLIDLDKLQLLINELKFNSDNIAIVRVKSNKQNLSIPFVGMKKLGKSALFNYVLTSNYMSGSIYNKKIIEKYNVVKYIKENLENEACLYYPHMVWDLVVCQYGSVLGLDVILLNEGKAEKTEVSADVNIGVTEKKTIPYYATLEGRLSQHKGFYDVIKDLEIVKNDFDVFRGLYARLCQKTIFLVNLSINVHYKKTDTHTEEFLKVAYDYSLELLEEPYQGKENHYKYKYDEDVTIIKECYDYYRLRS
ncbi:glycosyltransferase family 2 protein [Tissierella sp. Yu-01]|uniref:glycosyltransferase family 2 protein n=1 Tax=Tissierella sp. Yu-01 TaxID=3035694 RepID=UPI00240E2A99|nr:glycosyltransferase family 2 protein [Tissierella sp. Yu-01]WFA07915.1 glycosyltransferase family 2 protein [Tissierella sp. Yu-01]